MTLEFGPFQLDEAGRALTCARQNVQLQPRVFDLLVYLAHNRARVVSKDELLEAIWPAVTVTDNSLQRAISMLRTVLRSGGLESAIRNFPGKGYRLLIDGATTPSPAHEQASRKDTLSPLAQATEAFTAHAWTEAAELYQQTDRHGALSPENLDRWALALQCAGRPAAAVPLLMRAVADHAHAGDIRSAASDAVALSVIHLERCEEAVAKGWLARADDWAARLKDAVTTGLVLWMKSRVAASEGDPQQALSLAEQAYDCTRNQGVLKAEALSLAYRGFYRLSLGDTRGGFADQDHAAIIALSNNVDPITGGTLYCNILWACRMFGDWARADQWTLSYQKFCTDSRMELSGACQLHRSEVLGIKGSLPEALSRVQDALDRLSNDAPWSRGDAHRVLGDIHAAIGDDEAALEAYDKAYALGWCPEPGRAMLLLERGEAEAAYASLERSLIGQGWWTLQRRGILLAHLALAAARTGRHERAAALIAGLTGDTQRWPMPSIRALTSEARAVLALARSHHDEAIRFLHLSRQLWSSVDGRVHAARLRLQIATLLLDAGDMRGAGVETQAAQMAADGLQSGKLQRAGKELQHRITRVQPDPAAR